MPTYEYECKSCGHRFDVFQAISDDPVKNCTECGKDVRRLILGGSGVIFKGSGFYVTDKNNGSSVLTDKKPKAEHKPEQTGSQKSDATKSDVSRNETCSKCPAASTCSSSDAKTA